MMVWGLKPYILILKPETLLPTAEDLRSSDQEKVSTTLVTALNPTPYTLYPAPYTL